MFANLEKIVNEELGKNVEIEIYTPTQKLEYEIFSAYVGEANIEMKTNNSYEEILSKSELDFEYDENIKENNIVTLITCGANSQNRIVVSGLKK